jgi:hypothetical protein
MTATPGYMNKSCRTSFLFQAWHTLLRDDESHECLAVHAQGPGDCPFQSESHLLKSCGPDRQDGPSRRAYHGGKKKKDKKEK